MTVPIDLSVNGRSHELQVSPRQLLVHVLRDELDLTGTHVGCETSLCGACTVLVDGRAVKSCTMLAAQADGASVLTIEGLAAGDGVGADRGDGAGAPGGSARAADIDDREALHPLQRAFWEEHGLQCGFCTPGMILAARELLEEHPDPGEEEIREGLEGNLCRCTGYHNIVRAVQSAAAEMRGES